VPDSSVEFEEQDEVDAPGIADASVLPTCPGCGYDLSGTLESPEQRCPECGRVWAVEELALQHIVRARQPTPSNRFIGVFTPGLTVGGLLLLGLIFGPPVNWLTFPVAAILVVLAVVEWGRDQYRISFSMARSRLNRFGYVAGRTMALLAINVVFVVCGSALVLLMIASCTRFNFD
jgi:hypothetical protein